MDIFFLIFAWLFGLVSIWLGFPQSLFIGLIRGQLYRLEMSMNPLLRAGWGGGIGCFSWFLTSKLWQWFFDHPIPLIFVIGAVIWSLLVNFIFGEWKKLVGLAQGNEIALLIGSFFFVVISLGSGFYVFAPLGQEEIALNAIEEEPEITSSKVHGSNLLTSNDEFVNLTSSEENTTLYNFTEEVSLIIDDVKIDLRLPPELKAVNMGNYVGSNIGRFETSYKDESGYSLSVDFLESKTSNSLDVNEIFDVIDASLEEDTSWLLRAFPPYYEDLSVVSVGTNFLIDNKRFLRRITYYIDSRLDDTPFEDALVTEFHYATYYNGKKIQFTLSHHGDTRGVGGLIGAANTLAGTIRLSILDGSKAL